MTVIENEIIVFVFSGLNCDLTNDYVIEIMQLD